MYISWSVAAGILAGAQLALADPTVNAPSKVLRARQSDEPCALASSAVASFLADSPSATSAVIPAEIAYNCLKSVPFYPEPAQNLTEALKPIFQLQSTVDFLRAPPEGYLFEAIDLPRELDAIETKVLSSDDSYDGEYEFQVDLFTLIAAAKDGHFTFRGDLMNVFQWARPGLFLTSVSLDGTSLPQVYALNDIIELGVSEVSVNIVDNASPVKSINGLDVEDFFVAETNALNIQDPDSTWNVEFFSIEKQSQAGSPGLFNSPRLYPGPTTTVVFENGSQIVIDNVAVTRNSFDGIETGDDAYNAFCVPNQEVQNPTLESIISKRQSSDVTSLPFYPTPEVVDGSGLVSGYFLEDSDVAVLAIYGFEPTSGDSGAAFMTGFQTAVQDFLALAVSQKKTKLVIDLQGNGGGSIDLATDAYAQLFPDDPPNSMNNMRASLGMYGIILAASNAVDAAEATSDVVDDVTFDFVTQPFDFQDNITPDGESDFNSISQFYGPVHVGHGTFTSFFQQNFSNDAPAQFGFPSVVITGTNNRTGFTQPFEAENIIMVTDGFCASACTIFSEFMKRQGVQSIALGGRPQTGPMQAVGGVKGSQVFGAVNIQIMLGLFHNETLNTDLVKAENTIWENFNALPGARSGMTSQVNAKNQFRIGDDTQTPLHFVYEAADCRIYYTPDMLADPTAIWSTVASLAFDSRSDGVITSDLCVQDSTAHPTSLSGGLEPGSIGPQTPPDTAFPKDTGILINGTTIIYKLGGSEEIDGDSPVDPSVVEDGEDADDLDGLVDGNGAIVSYSTNQVKDAVKTMNDACSDYKGDAWFVKMMCGAWNHQGL